MPETGNKMKERKIRLGEKIPFEWMDSGRYGWAYFDVCIVMKRHKIVKLFIVPRQQNTDTYFTFETPKGYNAQAFDVSEYNCQTEAGMRSVVSCKEHKGICVSMIVPKESKHFELNFHFGNTICMDYHGIESCQKQEKK